MKHLSVHLKSAHGSQTFGLPMPFSNGVKEGVSIQVSLHEKIATAAYFLAERRRFIPGEDMDDWLQAEWETEMLY